MRDGHGDEAHAGRASSGTARQAGPVRRTGIVTDVHPQSTGIGLALGEHRDGRVVAVQSLGGQNMGLDAPVERHQCGSCRADLAGERRKAQGHALAGEALGLPVEGLVLPELLEQQHGKEARASPATRHDMERCWWLRDRLAIPAGKLLADGLDDLPLARDHLQRLGDVLAGAGLKLFELQLELVKQAAAAF